MTLEIDNYIVSFRFSIGMTPKRKRGFRADDVYVHTAGVLLATSPVLLLTTKTRERLATASVCYRISDVIDLVATAFEEALAEAQY